MTKQEIIHEYQVALARKGGQARSEKKTIACRLNAQRPRPNRKKKNAKA